MRKALFPFIYGRYRKRLLGHPRSHQDVKRTAKQPTCGIGQGMPSNQPFHFSTGTGGGFFDSSDSTDILASFCAGFGIGDDDDIFSRSLPQSTLWKERTVDDSGNRDSDGSSSPRREADRSAIYQPSPELKQPSMRRSET